MPFQNSAASRAPQTGYEHRRMDGGRMVFTGPNETRDHQPQLASDFAYVGERRHEPTLKTGDTRYLFRREPYAPSAGASTSSAWLRKGERVGDIGWFDRTTDEEALSYINTFDDKHQTKLGRAISSGKADFDFYDRQALSNQGDAEKEMADSIYLLPWNDPEVLRAGFDPAEDAKRCERMRNICGQNLWTSSLQFNDYPGPAR